MGACASSPRAKRSGGRAVGRPLTAKVIHIDGRIQEFHNPTLAGSVAAQNPDAFLCSSESLNVHTRPPRVPEDEELQPGQMYFLLPLSQSEKPLSLPDLCTLAIKASPAVEQSFWCGD